MIGRTLSQFRIESKLGAGGMGEVYLAHDTRLGRDVAIKLLPAALAGDPERLARLEREARLLASLNHPNIAAIHGLEQAEGIRFLVLERVLGESLAQRLGRGALPVDEALAVGRQVAEALDAAHGKGIIHRDLKPGNVMLTPDGKVKVLDFGLAKALSDEMPGGDASESPTITAMATREGVIHGTAAYMSPEQARGRPLDRRTDIWSFGCLLYESLSGRRPFQGESVPDTLAALLNTEPDWEKLPASTPPRICVLLKRCLRKDAQQRMRDVGDARLEIDEAIAGEPAPPLSASRPRLRLLPIAAGLLVGIILGWVMLSGWRAPARVIASSAGADWSGEMLLGGSLLAYGPRISPDGQTLAFQILIDGFSQVAIMKPGTGSWTVLTRDRTHGTVLDLSWSRDGTKIYYDRNSKDVFSIPALGGDERLVLEGASSPEALPDGSLLVNRTEQDRNEQFHRYWPDSGRLEAIGPRFLPVGWITIVRAFPDGKRAVVIGTPAEGAHDDGLQRLQILDLLTGENRVLAPDLTFAPTSEPYRALSVSPDGRSVITIVKSADIHRLVAIPVEGDPVIVPLVSLTASPWFAELAADGTLFLDQCGRSVEILKFPISGGVPETIVRTTGTPNLRMNPLQLMDDRILLSSVLAGRERLLVARPGGDPRPFIDTEEETGGPAIQLGNGEVVFCIGTGATVQIAMASPDGRILRRVAAPAGGRVRSLAVSPDGALLYYVDAGAIWSIPVSGGEARRIHAGDGVVVDSRNGDLIIQLNAMAATRLMRLSPDGEKSREIPFEGVAIAPYRISGRIIREDGRLVIASISGGAWFWYPAVQDPATGIARQVPMRFEGDVFPASWTNDGSILAMGWRLRSEIWRLKPGAADLEKAQE